MNLPQEVVDAAPWEAGALTLEGRYKSQVSGIRKIYRTKFFLRPET